MHRSIRRVGIVCTIVLVPIVVLLIASYPRIAAGATAEGNIAGSADQTQAVLATGGPAVPLDPASPPSTGLAPQGGINPNPLPGVPGYMWNYSAKFVCGVQQLPANGAANGEPPVKAGNYATEINIHNYNYKGIVIRKKVLLVVERDQVVAREPQQGFPRVIVQPDLGPDNVMMDDCNAVWTMLYPPPTTTLPAVMPLMIGYLVVISPLDLDIDVVYTAAEPGTPNAVTPSGFTAIAIDVTRVLGKRVFVPQ